MSYLDLTPSQMPPRLEHHRFVNAQGQIVAYSLYPGDNVEITPEALDQIILLAGFSPEDAA